MAATEPVALASNITEAMIPEETNELSSYWTLWLQSQPLNPNPKKKGKDTTMKPVFDFNTVEDFWSIFNAVRRPRDIATRLDVIYMRSQLIPPTEEELAAEAEKVEKNEKNEATEENEENEENEDDEKKSLQKKFIRVEPVWEDVNNYNGGEYRFTLSSDQAIAEKQWEYTLLSIIGGTFPYASEICGVWLGLGRKTGHTVSLWKRSPAAETPEGSDEIIAKGWLKMLADAEIPVVGELSYTTHQASLEAAAAPKWSDPVKRTWTNADFNKE